VPDDAAPHADTIVTGYAEQTWPQLLRDFQAGVMQPRYQQPADFTLADSPFPRREVLPTRSYLTEHVFEATRGCVHDCEFCVVPSAWGRRPWQKPVAHVVEDIRRMGSKRLIFVDLNLIADKAYARELFTALAPLRVEWFGLSTTLLCDDLPLLDLAAKSGCLGLLMGLESINPRSLRSSGKGFNHPEQFAQAVERLHERRIALQGCFVFGLDEDTSGVFEATAQFALDAKIDLPRFAIVTPFPGTALYRRHEQEGRLLHRDWSKYDGQHCVFQPRHLTPRELEQGTERAWKRVYSWSGIWQRLRHTAAPWPIALGTNLGYRFYAQRLHRFYQCDAGFAVPARPVLPALGTFAPTPVTVNAGEVAPPSP
jgi:radical SAM superfamily enzyme YgiQ (UPF0313 family)